MFLRTWPRTGTQRGAVGGGPAAPPAGGGCVVVVGVSEAISKRLRKVELSSLEVYCLAMFGGCLGASSADVLTYKYSVWTA